MDVQLRTSINSFIFLSLSVPLHPHPLHPRVLRYWLFRSDRGDLDKGKVQWQRRFAKINQEREQLERVVAHGACQPDFALVAQIVWNRVGPYDLKLCTAFWTDEQIDTRLLHGGLLNRIQFR
jgi:hypothetical protein